MPVPVPLSRCLTLAAVAVSLAVCRPGMAGGTPAAAPWQSIPDILAGTHDADWRTPAADRLMVVDLPAGRVVIELAPDFAPHHVANLRQLIHQHYFDGLAVLRVQDDYVAQWGDPDEAHPRPLGEAAAQLAPEFARTAAGLPFERLPDGDVYAPEVGFSDGFPVARDRAHRQAWLAHCYGMVGAGRDTAADSGNAAELYAVIGHAPRHLDRNVTLLGRVLQGIEHLSSLPRGSGDLGFYANGEATVPLRQVRLAADLPEGERPLLQVLRTDTATFRRIIESRRNRGDAWTQRPAGHIELCNVPLPVRTRP